MNLGVLTKASRKRGRKYEKYEKYEFDENELSPVAFGVYSNSSFTFWKEGGTFYYSDNPKSEKVELGNIEDVNEFLETFA